MDGDRSLIERKGFLPNQQMRFCSSFMKRDRIYSIVANRTGPNGRACESVKRFRLDETYAELKAAALSQNDLFDEPSAASEEGAETEALDCDCTD